MFYHNLLIIYRNFIKYKSSFLINLIGLSSGLACTILIYLWVADEIGFDKFHKNKAQLFQVMVNQQIQQRVSTIEYTPGPLAATLKNEMPEVEYASSVCKSISSEQHTLTVNDRDLKATVLYADDAFLKMFSYPLIQGNPDRLLSDKNSIVLTQKLVDQLFKDNEQVLGSSVEFQHEKRFIVTGVIENPPINSTSQFDFMLSYQLMLDQNPSLEQWTNYWPQTYLLLKNGTNVHQLNEKIKNLITEKDKTIDAKLFLRPYADKYLYGKYEYGVQVGGRIEYVKLFSIIAIFILLIACINFMNLSTAKASRRLKEIGIKKALGASRRILIYQYLGESLLMAVVSMLAALSIVILLLPHFNLITGKTLLVNFEIQLFSALTLITLFTGLIAGSYPALYLSGFHPIAVLRGKLNSSVSELWARKGLVIFQFALSVIFIVAVWVVYKQIEFVQHKNLGYKKDNLIYLDKEGKAEKNLDTFLSELRNIPGVLNASSIMGNIVGSSFYTFDISWEGKMANELVGIEYRFVNYDLIETLGIEMKEGASFSKALKSESPKIILNEAAVEVIGFKDPLGKTIRMGDTPFEVMGVMKNFHFESLHESVKPLVFILSPDMTKNIIIHIEEGIEKQTISSIEKFYHTFNAGFPFNYKFLESDFQALYAAENHVSFLSKYFAGLAIMISCLGLYGLAAFTAERRMKEISIRKTLGCSNWGIVALLTNEFTKTVFISIMVALPISYYIARKWLDSFAYKIELEIWYFIGAGLLTLFIAWITVGIQAFKAAHINLAKTMRSND